jgi:phosphoribosylamine--glycine ligase
LTRLESDLLDLLEACLDGTLEKTPLRWRPQTAVCVVMAAAGYPGTPAKGAPIQGLAAAGALPNTKIFHAGVARQGGGMAARGGRVLGVTAWDAGLDRARARAYEAVSKITFDGAQFRSDIGAKALRGFSSSCS